MKFVNLFLGLCISLQALAYPISTDTSRTATTAHLSALKNGHVLLTWTEKDKNNLVYFYSAISKDNGKSFSDKKLVFAHEGIGSSRLMKPKVLEKGDGTLVAVFGLRGTGGQPAPQPSSHDSHAAGGHDTHAAAAKPAPPKGGGRPRDMQIVYSYSKDQGTTWSAPAPVHQDQTAGVVRGFFDSAVMGNGEIAVAFLQDIPNQPHSRDMRLVTSSGLTFGQEKVIDDFTCDCCNISLLTDANGYLNVYYRENNENIRDIARMVSKDFGKSFGTPSILFPDKWLINGCPHSGPTSSALGKGSVVAWFSGSEDAPGLRVVNDQGKRLAVIGDPSAKNAFLVPTPSASVLLWEEARTDGESTTYYIAYRKVTAEKAADVQWLTPSQHGHSPSAVYTGNQLLVAYEVQKGSQSTIELSTVSL